MCSTSKPVFLNQLYIHHQCYLSLGLVRCSDHYNIVTRPIKTTNKQKYEAQTDRQSLEKPSEPVTNVASGRIWSPNPEVTSSNIITSNFWWYFQ